MPQQVQPIFILPEGTTKTSGRTAQKLNIEAAKLVADQVRTTLGPKGMDKMIVDSLGDITITNDGVTILQEMNIEHPTAKMIVEIAKTQEAEVGDGTTTAVILAGELLKNAEGLLEQNVHPTIVAKGFILAEAKSQEVLNKIAEDCSIKDKALLKNIAITAMTGKSAESHKDYLADLIVTAVTSVAEEHNSKLSVDLTNIKLEKKVGGGIHDTELVQGIVLDKERVHPGMPTQVKNAKIAILDCAIEVKDTETDAKIQITDPRQIQAFIDQEEKMIMDKVNKILASGANVVFCQKGIDDTAQYFLAKNGVYAARRVAKSDLEKLGKATGANIVTSLKELAAKDLGNAGFVEEIKFGDEQMTAVRDCKNPKAVTVLVRGGTEHVVAEIKRTLTDGIGDVRSALMSGKVVAGAGSVEIELAKHLRKYADSLEGKEQLAVIAFANAVEVVPRTLAESAGLDPIDKLAELKSAHDKGQRWAGIDVFTGKVRDAWKANVIEPLKIKTQAIKSASEVATMILRIDDVFAGGRNSGAGMPAPRGGMGGMPGMDMM
ncbi:TCP-1/cpn60 chaperonin family protein [Candidatus Woesearchaeota archaeon]|nr:TCP-1/cpn60 chaperonin family protein [Candidatus Woesearchaeota archaeon]